INLAQPGYITSQEVIVLGLYGAPLKPDVVVSIDGINDIVDITKTGQIGMPYQNAVIVGALDHPFFNVFMAVGRHSQFINVLNKLAERRLEVRYQTDTKLIGEMLDAYIQNLDTISALSHGLGAPHVRVLQPYMPLRANRTVEEKNSASKYTYRFDFMNRT